MEITTPHGRVRLPAYMPVTTFGGTYPLDELIRPYLPREADCLMVSYHYARQMTERPAMPLFIDSGGFAALLPGAVVNAFPDGTAGVLVPLEEGAPELITPDAVLRLQELHADFGAPLDFPIPPGCPPAEAERRLAFTLANARWALEHRKSAALRLFGCVQGYDRASYLASARWLVAMGYRDLAVGGLVPRLHDKALVLAIVRDIAELGPELLHVFGAGEPALARALVAAGATSVDSSSYVRAAADGKCWDGERLEDPSGLERAHIALRNLRQARFQPGEVSA